MTAVKDADGRTDRGHSLAISIVSWTVVIQWRVTQLHFLISFFLSLHKSQSGSNFHFLLDLVEFWVNIPNSGCCGRGYSIEAKCHSTSRTAQKLRLWNRPLGLRATMTPPILIIYLSMHKATGSCESTQTVRLPLAPPPGLWLLHYWLSHLLLWEPLGILPISFLYNSITRFIPVNWNSFPGRFYCSGPDSWGETSPLIFLEGYFPVSAEWNCSVAAFVACGNQYKHLMRKVSQTGTRGRQHHQAPRKSRGWT